MKKLYYMMAAIAIVMTGCNDQTEIINVEPETPVVLEGLTIKATTDKAVTRTEMSNAEGKYSMVWSKNDQIAVVHKGTGLDVAQLFQLSSGEGTTTGTFTDLGKVKNGCEGKGSDRACDATQACYLGYYPASTFYTWYEANGTGKYVYNASFAATQKYSADGPVDYPMAAFTDNVGEMNFEGLASVLQLNISCSLSGVKVKDVYLSGSNGLAGFVGLTVSAENTLESISYSALDHNVTIDCSESPVALNSTAKPFYAQILPGEQSNLTIKVVLAKEGDNTQYFASFSAKNLTFKAKHMYPITLNITQVKTDMSAEPIRGSDANAAIKILAGNSGANDIDQNIQKINFIPNSAAKGDAIISTSTSAFPVYASYADGVVNITTLGPKFTLGSDCERLFYNLAKLEEINGLEYLDTKAVESFALFFASCDNLKSLDLSHFDTSSATDMSDMFDSCSSLASLNVSNFKTDNVKTMGNMFSDCTSLTSLDLRNFNVWKVNDFSSFFGDCTNLRDIYMPQMLDKYGSEKWGEQEPDLGDWSEGVSPNIYGNNMSILSIYSGLAAGKSCTFHCKNEYDVKILNSMKEMSDSYGELTFEACSHKP